MDRVCLREERRKQCEGTQRTKRAVVESGLWSPASDAPHRSPVPAVYPSWPSTWLGLCQLESPEPVLESPSVLCWGAAGSIQHARGWVAASSFQKQPSRSSSSKTRVRGPVVWLEAQKCHHWFCLPVWFGALFLVIWPRSPEPLWKFWVI